jgi:hypothetical protein
VLTRALALRGRYKEEIDPTFVYENFTIAEQDKILAGNPSSGPACRSPLMSFPAARRSNNELDSTKLTNALRKVSCVSPPTHTHARAR